MEGGGVEGWRSRKRRDRHYSYALSDRNSLQARGLTQQGTTGFWSVYAASVSNRRELPFVREGAGVMPPGGGGVRRLSPLALDGQTHQKDSRITSGIRLGEAINNQGRKTHTSHARTHTHSDGNNNNNNLVARGSRLVFPSQNAAEAQTSRSTRKTH